MASLLADRGDPDTSFWSHLRTLALILGYESSGRFLARRTGEFPLPDEQLPPEMIRIFSGKTRPVGILPLFEDTPLNRKIVYQTARLVWECYGSRVRILRFRPMWQDDQSRLDGDQILDMLSNDNFLGTHSRMILLTDRDVFSGRNRWLYGYAGVHVPVCAVSTFRLGFERGADREAWRRLLRVLVHELGHTYGLGHCPYASCIMHDVPDAGLLAMQLRFCATCRTKLTHIRRRISRIHKNR